MKCSGPQLTKGEGCRPTAIEDLARRFSKSQDGTKTFYSHRSSRPVNDEEPFPRNRCRSRRGRKQRSPAPIGMAIIWFATTSREALFYPITAVWTVRLVSYKTDH